MNAEQLKSLRKAAEEATPGPWSQGLSEEGIECVWLNGLSEPESEIGPSHTWIDCVTKANAGLISAANPQAILQLLDYIETLEKDAARLDWLERKCTGASDSERYLPFRVYWNQKGIRKTIDKAMGETK